MNNNRNRLLAVILSLIFSVFVSYAVTNSSFKSKKSKITIIKKRFSMKMYPCEDCHDGYLFDFNPRKRNLSEHKNIRLKHSERRRWCIDCHHLYKRNYLKLANNERVPFGKSHRLCGQCHGPNYRDWKDGLHGKRTGMWNGDKKHFQCTYCHNPHNPRFKEMKPMKRPLKPIEIVLVPKELKGKKNNIDSTSKSDKKDYQKIRKRRKNKLLELRRLRRGSRNK
ncbi:hypothetical protein ACFL20_11200 [Spirochaetota bacterium]